MSGIDKPTWFLAGFGVGSVFALFVVIHVFNDAWQKDCVKHGAAEYVITDPATGAVAFRWKEPKP